MSFIEPSDAGLNHIGPTPAAPPEPKVEEPPVPEAPAETEPETFSREYVTQLRQEAANYRTRSKEWLDATDGMEPELAQGWLELIQVAKSGDPEALVMVGQALGFIDPQAPAETAQPTGEGEFLTRDQAMQLAREIANEAVQTQLSQHEQARQQAEQIQTIQSRAKTDFGIETDSPDYVVLLKFANEIDPATLAPGQDLLSAANDKLQAWNQQRYDDWIATKEGQARQTPTFPAAGGQPSTAAPAAKTFGEARDRFHERLMNQG